VFDLRYHVASLAAVFIALVIGILVGVGISGRGLIRESERAVLQDRIDQLRDQLDETREAGRATDALSAYERETYPLVMEGRLAEGRIAVVYVGSAEGPLAADIRETLDRADATLVRTVALKVPIETGDLLRRVPSAPDAPQTVEALGRALADELVDGGDTPHWDAVDSVLVEERDGGTRTPIGGVVVARTGDPQRGQTARFLAGFYGGLAASGVPVVGVETTEADPSAVDTYRSHGFSTVDHLDTAMGRVALAVLLEGNERGAFGIRDGVDGALPNVEPVPPPSG
jgi:hypothetical protein